MLGFLFMANASQFVFKNVGNPMLHVTVAKGPCAADSTHLETGGFNGGWNLVNVSEVMQYSHRGTC